MVNILKQGLEACRKLEFRRGSDFGLLMNIERFRKTISSGIFSQLFNHLTSFGLKVSYLFRTSTLTVGFTP